MVLDDIDRKYLVRTWVVVTVCREHLADTLRDIQDWISTRNLQNKCSMPIIKADHRGRDEILIRCSYEIAERLVRSPDIRRLDPHTGSMTPS